MIYTDSFVQIFLFSFPKECNSKKEVVSYSVCVSQNCKTSEHATTYNVRDTEVSVTQASKESELLGQFAFRVPLLLQVSLEKTVQDSNAKLCEKLLSTEVHKR